jgi:SagB-type dehydrogenase family enzyme
MKKFIFYLFTTILTSVFFLSSNVKALDIETIYLPEPRKESGEPLMKALNNRKSTRDFSDRELSLQTLSDLLWAGFGINRPESGKRTAPSAVNWQEIDIYISNKKGLYIYNAKEHRLDPIHGKDIRNLTGTQNFVKDAPLNLIYVADYSKMGNSSKEQKDFYSAADTGFISQNVYLYCASAGLATVVRALIDREKLNKEMNLKHDQKIILAQTVGYPAK